MLFWLFVYVICSSMGLTIIKIGLNRGVSLTIQNSFINIQLNIAVICGIALYAVSFLLSMFVMNKMNLNYYYPLSAGLIYVAICIVSAVLLKETMTAAQLIGSAVILAGIIIMNIKS